MVDRLTHGPASVSQLAEPLEMSLPAVLQHLRILEGCGLVRSRKVGRVRRCTLQPDNLRAAEGWIAARRSFWEQQFDRLGAYLAAEPGAAPPPQSSRAEPTPDERPPRSIEP